MEEQIKDEVIKQDLLTENKPVKKKRVQRKQPLVALTDDAWQKAKRLANHRQITIKLLITRLINEQPEPVVEIPIQKDEASV